MKILNSSPIGTKHVIPGDSIIGTIRQKLPDGTIETVSRTVLIEKSCTVDTMVFVEIDEGDKETLGVVEGIGCIFGKAA